MEKIFAKTPCGEGYSSIATVSDGQEPPSRQTAYDYTLLNFYLEGRWPYCSTCLLDLSAEECLQLTSFQNEYGEPLY